MLKNKKLKPIEHNVKESKTFIEWHDDLKENKDLYKKYKKINNITYLIGAPNVGKSTFFNKITTSTAPVSNVDRMTVSNNIGRIKNTKTTDLLVDLPGVYNLSHPIDEELVVIHELISEKFDNIANIIGAQSLQRDLYLTIQSIETGLTNALVINMIDEINIKLLDVKKMSLKLNNINISLCQANKSINLNEAKNSFISKKKINPKVITYSPTIEEHITKLSAFLPKRKISNRFYSLMLLEGNNFVLDFYKDEHPEVYQKILKIIEKNKFANDIYDSRIKFIQSLIKDTLLENNEIKLITKNKTKQRMVDRKLLNKWIGLPALLLLMIAMYFVSFGPYMGGSLKDLFGETFLNGIVADQWLRFIFEKIVVDSWWVNFFIDGIFKGVFSILSFIPVILIMFFLVNLIQQVGIISRISVLLDNTFSKFGLSGRSVVNLMSGFGCSVPAIMMARSSNSKKERIVSILITPFIACSARAIVFSLVCNAIFGITLGWIGMIALMLLSGAIALGLGYIFSQTMFRKQKSFFLVEMVDWRRPDFYVIFKNVWIQIVDFVKKVATFILVANFVIWLFSYLGPQGYILNDANIDKSFIGYLGKSLNWLMFPMGGMLDQGFCGQNDGWKLTVSLISAFPAKEIAVSNITILFGSLESFNSYASSHIAMCLSYLVIFMIYVPCLATVAIIKKEGSWKLLGIHLGTSLLTSYVLGFITFWTVYGICK